MGDAARAPTYCFAPLGSAGKQAAQQQPGSTPTQHPPELLCPCGALQTWRQGIQQPLSQGKVLAAATLRTARGRTRAGAEAEGGQAVQIPQGMEQPGPPGQERLPAPKRTTRGGAAQRMTHGARMGQILAPRLGDAAMQPPSANPSSVQGGRRWPAGSQDLAQQLQRSLSIGDRDWHALKGQRQRRAAEQLAGALVLLLAEEGGSPSEPSAARRQEALERTSLALAWLKGEIRDPGCPQHGR